jgi:hypothetical protein
VTDEAGDRRQEDSEDRAAKPRKAVVRPTNWQEPVILLMLRQWNSYGYE